MQNQERTTRDFHIGAKIKHTRRMKSMRLIDVAKHAGCSESLLSKIENDKATPSLS